MGYFLTDISTVMSATKYTPHIAILSLERKGRERKCREMKENERKIATFKMGVIQAGIS